ncbi:hypothetical protein AB0I66_26925 [Streptomyces sp. NPDC050439]|uniref:hypothetical protein n=1 Tax=Streptomyces sp. NPDC050439 TaxID=3155517 RepID=UPI003434DD30
MEERLVPSPEARADEIVAGLSAAGFTPRLQHHADRISIETKVPSSVSAESWQRLLTLLMTSDGFGLDTTASGTTARAAVRKETPATIRLVRGHGHQP